MANAYTTTTSIPNVVQTAYDKLIEFQLRAAPMFRPIADKRPAQVTNPGESVIFQLYNDLAPVTAPLSETVDPDAVALGNTNTVTVTLQEYGNAALITRRLSVDALSDVDGALANVIGWNMIESMDALVQAKLAGGTQVLREAGGALKYNSGARTEVTGTDVIKSRDIRFAVADLRTKKVAPRLGDLYWCGIHPQVSHDLRAETGAGAWRTPHEYAAPGQIWDGSIGVYEGAAFFENPRCINDRTGAGAAGAETRVFNTYLAGRQALAEAVNVEPGIVIGEVTDKLRRLRPVGWYGFLGWGLYRQDSLLRLETTSSMRNAA